MAEEPLAIQVQGTPNPDAAKFTLNRVIATQGTTYRLSAPTPPAEWAQRILDIPGVVQIFTVNNFVSVTKRPDAQWSGIATEVERILRQAFA